MISLLDLRQSTAELLACVVTDLFTGAYVVNCTATEFGFYADFVAEQPIDTQSLVLLEEKMRALIKQNLEVRRVEMMRENAANFLAHRNQPFIAQRVLEAPTNIVALVQIGDFYDYCPFPQISRTQEAVAFKLLSVERTFFYIESEGEIGVTRIHGTVCRDSFSLKKFLKALTAGKKKDHVRLGKESDLFGLHPQISQHAWCWHHAGSVLREVLLDWWRKEHRKQGFQLLTTPPLVKEDLFSQSECLPGSEIEGVNYVVPHSISPVHAILFQSTGHDVQDLPIRYAECAYVADRDRRKHLWGIFGASVVYADKAHIFCDPAQVEKELISSLQFFDKSIKMFSFEYHWSVKGQGEKYAGTPSRWKRSYECLYSAFAKSGLSYTLDESESSYEGPVARARLIDSMKREWWGPCVGFDFHCAERYNLRYQDANAEKLRPVMLVREFFGSMERWIGLLVEHYGGHFPVWLAPVQVKVIPLGKCNHGYAQGIQATIEAAGFRVDLDEREDSLKTKIHAAECENVPYIVIVGEKEEKQNLITVRSCLREVAVEAWSLEVFVRQLQQEVLAKTPPQRMQER